MFRKNAPSSASAYWYRAAGDGGNGRFFVTLYTYIFKLWLTGKWVLHQPVRYADVTFYGSFDEYDVAAVGIIRKGITLARGSYCAWLPERRHYTACRVTYRWNQYTFISMKDASFRFQMSEPCWKSTPRHTRYGKSRDTIVLQGKAFVSQPLLLHPEYCIHSRIGGYDGTPRPFRRGVCDNDFLTALTTKLSCLRRNYDRMRQKQSENQ